MKYLIIALLFLSINVNAGERTAVSKVDKNITFTITDEPCTEFPALPNGAPLKAASSYDATKKTSINGCALNYGDLTELQLINEAEKKHIQIMIPTKDFI